MSKKMMRRSLALGALMAFVITGSAMAADVTQELDSKEVSSAGRTIQGFGIVTGTEDLNIKSTGDNAVTAVGGKLTVTANGNINLNAGTANGNGNAVLAHSDLDITANGGDMNLYGDNRIVRVTDGATVNLKAKNIYMNADKEGKAVGAIDDGQAIKVTGGSNLYIEAENDIILNAAGGNGYAVYAEKNANGVVSLDAKKIDIIALEQGASGVYAYNDPAGGVGHTVKLGSAEKNSVVNIDADYIGIRAYSKSGIEVVTEGKELNVNVANNGWAAIYASNNDSVVVGQDAPSKIIINSAQTNVTSGNTMGIAAFSHGIVDVKGGLDLDADNIAISARGSAAVYVNSGGKGKVTIDGNITFDNNNADPENIHNGANATVDINMVTADSYLKGSIYTDDLADNRDATLNKYVKGMKLGLSEGATWTVTNDSFVNDIYGTKGTIELTTVEEDNTNRLAKVDILGTNSNADLIIKQAEVTADDVAVEDQRKHLDDLAAAITAETTNYTLVIEEGAVVGAVTATVDADGKAGKAVEAVNTVNKSIGEAAVVGIAHMRAHMNDMNKRLGELRMANGENGVWTRMVRGEEEFAGAKSQYNQYQLGYDKKLSTDKRWTVGAAVTFAEGSGNFTNGSIENDSTAFAIYGSKLNNDGTFVDLIGRYAKFDSDVTMSGEKADYSTNGMSVSAEFGKRIQQGNGLWIEPQFELTYGTVDSAEYEIAGRKVQVGDMDSLIGRVGFSLGKDIKQGNVYARASYLYDFDGETETTFGKGDVTRTIAEDLGGGWWEVGVGANINLSKATYIYADVEKTFGGEVDTNWKWNLGVRYSF